MQDSLLQERRWKQPVHRLGPVPNRDRKTSKSLETFQQAEDRYVGVRNWLARGHFIPGTRAREGGGQALPFGVAHCSVRGSGLDGLACRVPRGPVWIYVSIVHRYESYGSVEPSVGARWDLLGNVGFRRNPDLARQDPMTGLDRLFGCPVLVYD